MSDKSFDPRLFEPRLFEPSMPEVDEPPKIEEFFAKARKVAAEDTTPGKGNNRHVVVVTPGRLLMMQPCPAPGSMTGQQVEAVEKILSSKTKRDVAVIAYTELKALQASIAQTIPFFGLLLGFAYIGHSVWVFEGHPSTLAAGSRDADLLIADGGMIPFLATDWITTASSVMRRPPIFAHERATFTLRRLFPAVQGS